MPIANAYKEAVQNIINKLNAEVTSTKPRRHLSTMFLDLPDPATWVDYYTIITEPRSLNGVQEKLQKNRYRNIIDVLNDLHLVFANALHYNEASSQIAKDATVLKALFEQLWKDDPYLPNAQPTKQPGRKPGFRAAPLPRMSSFAPPMRHSGSFQPSYSTAIATVQVKPIGKPPAPIVAPRLQPLKKRKRKRAQKKEDVSSTSGPHLVSRPRRPGSPAFSEINFNSNLEVEDEDSEVPQTHIANEAETDVIVQRLDATLPKWEPWQQTAENAVILNSGWMPELHGEALQAKLEEFVSRMKVFLNTSQQRPLSVLEEVATRPDPLTTCEEFLAWASITTRISQRAYNSSKQFEMDLFRLFEKSRRFYRPTSHEYGLLLTCQRITSLLTSANPRVHGAPLTMSSRPGPRQAKPFHYLVDGNLTENPEGTLAYDVIPKGRAQIDYLVVKGIQYKPGDFIHLFNPEDMSRPLIGQIWNCWRKDGSDSLTVCWYLRPEQTVHSPDHPFYENEVVKSGFYVDYTPEDIVEKVCVQFHPQYFSGRPRTPHWYPSWPLYMCVQRYDDRNRLFYRITNPEMCFPPALRITANKLPTESHNNIVQAAIVRNTYLDAMQPIWSFERLVYPIRKSGPNAGPRLPSSSNGPTSFTIGPSDGVGGSSQQTGFDPGKDGRGRPKRMAAVKAASAVVPASPGSPGSPAPSANTSGVVGTVNAPPGDRTVVSAAGTGLITAATVDKLPYETTRNFDRDPITNEMLWFSGAPIDVARPPKLQYSLEYLYQMAIKQKQASEDTADASEAKRQKLMVMPTASEVWYNVTNANVS